MDIRFGKLTECGPVRQVNQDAVCGLMYADKALFLVADGMGGHSHGELASNAVAQGMSRWFSRVFLPQDDEERTEALDQPDQPAAQKVPDAQSFDEIVESLCAALQAENKSIFLNYNQSGQICGTTLVLLFCMADRYAVVSIGDSRIYRQKTFGVEQVTTDDVWENDAALTAGLTDAQIREHKNRGKLLRAFGTADPALLHVQTGKLEPNSTYLLCSDGIYKCMSNRELHRCLRHAKRGTAGIEKSLQQLEQTALDHGTRDNYSAIVLRTE